MGLYSSKGAVSILKAVIYCLAMGLFLVACYDEFEPELLVLDKEIDALYNSQRTRNESALYRHCAPCEDEPPVRCHPLVRDMLVLPAPRSFSCRVVVLGRYSSSGRAIRVFCKVERGSFRYTETHWVSALFPENRAQCSRSFQFLSFYSQKER